MISSHRPGSVTAFPAPEHNKAREQLAEGDPTFAAKYTATTAFAQPPALGLAVRCLLTGYFGVVTVGLANSRGNPDPLR